MHLNIQGRHLSITPALNDYVKTKLKKVKYYFDHIVHAHVVLQTERTTYTAEATITVEHHHFHNKITTEDMYKSIDLLFDKIERQVRRYKEALRDKKRRMHHSQRQFYSPHVRELEQLQKTSQIFIDETQIDPKPLNHLEAALQLLVDDRLVIKGYFNLDQTDHISFLIKEAKPNKLTLIAYDGIWEVNSLELLEKKDSRHKHELRTHHVEPIKPSLESIEDAIDFLRHNVSLYRFFTSLRTETEMLLYKTNQNHFQLLREAE